MKIIPKEDYIKFSDVYVGDVFRFKNRHYMRILSITCSGIIYNAVNLNSGELTHFELHVNVINVPGAFNAK